VADAPTPAPVASDGFLGQPVDALSTLFDAASRVARETPLDHPDPKVSAAFALGWQMAELYRPDRWHVERGVTVGALPALAGLNPPQRLQLLLDQIDAALAALRSAVTNAGLSLPDLTPIRDLGEHTEPGVRRAQILDFHVTLLAVLTAVDFRIGKAYGLGRALADTCRSPTTRHQLAEAFDEHRVVKLTNWLDDLSSALPPHAGHSVGVSLGRWRQWVAALPQTLPPGTLERLRRQGELWRALLSGEKSGADMLEIGNYLDAAGATFKRMEALLGRVLGRFWYVALLVVALYAGAIWLMLSVDNNASIVAGAAAILAGLGITWQGLGSSLGLMAGRLERPLWGAEVDAAIADAINLIPGNPRDYRKRGERAEVTPAVDPMAGGEMTVEEVTDGEMTAGEITAR